MKVLHLNYTDLIGGAAKGMYILHNELKEQGIDSLVVVAQKTVQDSLVIELYNKEQREERLNIELIPKRFYKNAKSFMINSNFIDSIELREVVKEFNPDIIHIHWIGNGLCSINDLVQFNKPIVWTLRDWAVLCGGCHHPFSCINFQNDCGKCPILQSDNKYDLTYQNMQRKKNIFNNLNLTLVGISPHMSNEATKSSLNFKNIVTIHNNIDDDNYYPISKEKALRILNIQTSKKIISIGASDLSDIHKGFFYFIEAIKQIDQKDILVLLFGKLNQKDLSKLTEFCSDYRYFSTVDEESILRAIYNVSDLFVAPSLYEPFGKTIAEAMICKTPVVSFKDAGGPDFIIDHKENGYLANKADSNDLLNGIKFIIQNNDYSTLASNAYKKIKRYFIKEKIANDYINLYKTLIPMSNSFYTNLIKLPDMENVSKNLLQFSTKPVIVYGYGYMSKFIETILGDRILFFLDKDINKVDNKTIFHPTSFPEKNAYILVSITNRFEEINNYLTKELNLAYNVKNLIDFMEYKDEK